MAYELILVIVMSSIVHSESLYYCEDSCNAALGKGPTCDTTNGDAYTCLREEQCDGDLSEKLKVFERNVCDSPYLTEFLNKTNCWREVFKECHDVVIVASDTNRTKACRGKPAAGHFCLHWAVDELNVCRLPSRRLLNIILKRQNCNIAIPLLHRGCRNYCEGNILQGPSCNGEKSPGVKCLKGCEDPFLRERGNRLEVFDGIMCAANKTKKVLFPNGNCWLSVFHQCHDAATTDIMSSDSYCQTQGDFIADCRHRLSATGMSRECLNFASVFLQRLVEHSNCVKSLSDKLLPSNLLIFFFLSTVMLPCNKLR